MSELITNPFFLVGIAWVCGALTGAIVGRSLKTTPFELARIKAEADLAAIKRTIELCVKP